MPKGILEFDLDTERESFEIAQDGARLSYVINELDNYLRNRLKYDELTEEQHEVYDRIRRKLTELRNDE